MAGENFPTLSWAAEMDSQDNLGGMPAGEAAGVAREIVGELVDDATVAGELAVTVEEVK